MSANAGPAQKPEAATSRRGASRAVDPGLPIPLHHQIYMLLREQIPPGVYADHALAPTDLASSGRFGVSRITAKCALDEPVLGRNGRPVEDITIRCRPDQHRYCIELNRLQGRASKLWSTTE